MGEEVFSSVKATFPMYHPVRLDFRQNPTKAVTALFRATGQCCKRIPKMPQKYGLGTLPTEPILNAQLASLVGEGAGRRGEIAGDLEKFSVPFRRQGQD